MGLVDAWDIERTWGSHQAVLKAVVEVLKPESAVECGCGNFSTPILAQLPSLHTYEHDIVWANKMRADYADHEWTMERISAKNPDRISELPENEFENICKLYSDWAKEQGSFDLLFVDTFTCCRVPATACFGLKAKYIISHDHEPPGEEVYNWSMLDPFLAPWYKYTHRPDGKINGVHQIPWTNLYSREELDIDALNSVLLPESRRLWGVDTKLEIIND